MKKPRPASKIGRKRRAAGWTMLTLGVIVAGVWVASGWWSFRLASGSVVSIVDGGVASVSMLDIQPLPMGKLITLRDRAFPFRWWYHWTDFQEEHGLIRERWLLSTDVFDMGFKSTAVSIILWPLPVLLLTPAALLLRSGILARRRAIKDACVKCGYSLAGLAKDAPCPECGTSVVFAFSPSSA